MVALLDQVKSAWEEKSPEFFRTRVKHFLLGKESESDCFLKHLIFKHYSKEDAQKLKPFFDAFCQEIRSIEGRQNVSYDLFLGKLDRLAAKSVDKILNQPASPGSPWTIGQVTGTLRPVLESDGWVILNKGVEAAPLLQKPLAEPFPPAFPKPLQNDPQGLLNQHNVMKRPLGARFAWEEDAKPVTKHLEQCVHCGCLMPLTTRMLRTIYQDPKKHKDPKVYLEKMLPRIQPLYLNAHAIADWMHSEEEKNPEVFKDKLNQQFMFSAYSLAYEFHHKNNNPPQMKPVLPPADGNNNNNYKGTPKQAAQVTKDWLFDLNNIIEMTDSEANRYKEILAAIEAFPDASLQAKKNAKSTVFRFSIFHEFHPAICAEVFGNGLNFSDIIWAEKKGDILLHPEQTDAPLEQRAHIFYNSLEAAWLAVHQRPALLKKFIDEAFYEDAVCLEAQSKKITDWLEANKAYLDTEDSLGHVKNQTKAKNIQDLASELFENAKKTSEAGKDYLEAQQEKEKVLGALQKLADDQNQAPQPKLDAKKVKQEKSLKYINLSLPVLDAKFEKWMTSSKKYEALQEELALRLEGKVASDGVIMPADIKEVLINQLCWPLKES